jgi:HAD superfamily hydrolase (TIGR01509 family)
MDGTLIDTEPYWMAAEIELVEAHGGTWTADDALAMVGNSMVDSAAKLQARGVVLTVAEITDFLNSRVGSEVAAGIPWQAGARALLDQLVAAQVPLALVTSSFAVLADPFARAVAVFDTVVSGDEVTRNKPDPEPYLTAASRLRVDIRSCVVVEDSPAGIASARAAGARVLAVQVIAPIEPLDGLSITDSLAHVTLEHLARIAAGEVLDLRRASERGPVGH